MNLAKSMTMYNSPGIIKTAFPTVMSPKNLQSEFGITGIWPLNLDIIQESDFAPSAVTD